MNRKKLILLTNDDGFDAEGIMCLQEALSEIAECIIVAPAEERSACSHAITLHGSLRFEKVFKDGLSIGYKVWGMPADCVKLALCELLDRQPDLIVSGINNGANVGVSIYYSGTVSAAREGAILGIPSLALSVVRSNSQVVAYAAFLGVRFAERLLNDPLPVGTLLNVNVPDREPAEMNGIYVVNQADSYFDEWFVKTDDDASREPAYILYGDMLLRKPSEMNDANAIRKGYVAVTPLRIDLTDHTLIEQTQKMFQEINVDKTEVVAE